MNEAIDIMQKAMKMKDDVLKQINHFNIAVSKSNNEVKIESATVVGEVNKMNELFKNGNLLDAKNYADTIVSKYADKNS